MNGQKFAETWLTINRPEGSQTHSICHFSSDRRTTYALRKQGDEKRTNKQMEKNVALQSYFRQKTWPTETPWFNRNPRKCCDLNEWMGEWMKRRKRRNRRIKKNAFSEFRKKKSAETSFGWMVNGERYLNLVFQWKPTTATREIRNESAFY